MLVLTIYFSAKKKLHNYNDIGYWYNSEVYRTTYWSVSSQSKPKKSLLSDIDFYMKPRLENLKCICLCCRDQLYHDFWTTCSKRISFIELIPLCRQSIHLNIKNRIENLVLTNIWCCQHRKHERAPIITISSKAVISIWP